MGFNKYWVIYTVPFAGFMFGRHLDILEKERSIDFRDKSELFRGRRKPGEPPSW